MQLLKRLPTLAFLFLPSLIFGQTMVSLAGGISSSQLPIYSQREGLELIRAIPANKLTFTAGLQHDLNKHLSPTLDISYTNLGVTSLYNQLDSEFPFLNRVTLQYLSVSYIPRLEFEFGEFTIGAGIGGSAAITLDRRIENYQNPSNTTIKVKKSEIEIKKKDLGLTANLDIKRVIGNDVNMVISLRRYQGILNISTIDREGTNKVLTSFSAFSIGLQMPIKRKKRLN